MQIFDLSLPIEENVSDFLPLKILHQDHIQNASVMERIFGCEKTDLPQGMGWATDSVEMSTHSGTHVDAPWHYYPSSENKPARTIDQIPLEWFFHDGVVLDMRYKERGSIITVDDIGRTLDKMNYKIKPWDIVLIQTGADKLWGTGEYLAAGCGMGKESTHYLIDQGVRVMGTDAWGFDPPFVNTRENFKKTKNPDIIWAAHRVGIEKEYCHIEKLANLDKLPIPFGFKVACFPVKVDRGSAGWSRVVAIIE